MIRRAAPPLFLHLRTRGGLHTDVRPEAEASALGRFCADTVPVWSGRGDGLLLDMTGTARLYGPGLAGSTELCRRAAGVGPVRAAGLAPTPLAAHLASLLADRSRERSLLAVPPGSVQRFLSVFPLRLLRRAFPTATDLNRLGVRTLGDLQVVPEALVQAVCGPAGVALAHAARGLGTTRLDVPPDRGLERELVVGARWKTPLAGREQARALRQAFALRAVGRCGNGGPPRSPWVLRSQWPDGRTRHSRLAAWNAGGWSDWQGLLTRLWRGLGTGRTGMTRLELWSAVPAGGSAVQESLFPADSLDRALADVMARAALQPSGGLRAASQVVLASLQIRWYGPANAESGRPPSGPGGIVDAFRSGG